MNGWFDPPPHGWQALVDRALEEDLGTGDLAAICLDPAARVSWCIEAQGDGVLCGAGVVAYLLDRPDEFAACSLALEDGEPVGPGTRVAEGVGPARLVTAHERVALNFLMTLSGTATLTRAFVDRLSGTRARLVDTRKTLPGLRSLQKYAVRCGGGHNHRMGLYDAAMVKDNHLRACGGPLEAVARIRRVCSHLAGIEVECESAEQVEAAIRAGADTVMLDNMAPDAMAEIVARHRGKARFEASGGIRLDTVRAVAESGVDLVSVSAVTMAAPPVPFHLEFA
ncbi:MAG: carboxylating nicotinate-nucleotide diphosphorylase [Fimbriimonadaceae bacterium]|nr:carboxylating nicotinate-nucleotide diphosphorylase [Fimbriimonadaceae bacterium]